MKLLERVRELLGKPSFDENTPRTLKAIANPAKSSYWLVESSRNCRGILRREGIVDTDFTSMRQAEKFCEKYQQQCIYQGKVLKLEFRK